jgi:hypothetical protein
MRFLRYFGRLLKEFFQFAMQNKAWWIIPIILMLLLIGIAVFTSGGIAPFIYTLF